MTCTYGFSHFRHLQNCCYRDEIQFLNTWSLRWDQDSCSAQKHMTSLPSQKLHLLYITTNLDQGESNQTNAVIYFPKELKARKFETLWINPFTVSLWPESLSTFSNNWLYLRSDAQIDEFMKIWLWSLRLTHRRINESIAADGILTHRRPV